MAENRPTLRLAHSPDPDDVFMWWPITGKVDRAAWNRARSERDGEPAPVSEPPVIDTGRFRFAPVPADIEVLNRRAAEAGDLEITALSMRAWLDVRTKYRLTSCGSSFGEGYGPKVVAHGAQGDSLDVLRRPGLRFAVPGKRTTAFLLLGILLGRDGLARSEFVEMPFDRVIGAVAGGEADAGLVIHEGQVTYEAAGLRQVVDLGAWWKQRTGLPTPLGGNAVRSDLDERFGAGVSAEVAATLRRSLGLAMERREESLDYAMTFALAAEGGGLATRERVARYLDMYVNRLTLDMGEAGRHAIKRLFEEGAAAGLCEAPGSLETL